MLGQVFTRLTVVSEAGSAPAGGRMWLCACACGRTKAVRTCDLNSGAVKSCGCLYVETRRTAGTKNRKHFGNGTRAYVIWKRIRYVCYNPNAEKYPIYGGRGIKICDRWRNSFTDFLADMGQPPSGMSIGRIDNDGDYEPSNCRWETPKQQANNTRSNRSISHAGITLTVAQWADRIGVSYNTLWMRLRRGWTIAEAVCL